MNMAQAFNEWMRRYIEEPERFAREWQAVEVFKADDAAGIEPDYGHTCEGYLRELMREKRSKRTGFVVGKISRAQVERELQRAQLVRIPDDVVAAKMVASARRMNERAAKRKRRGKGR